MHVVQEVLRLIAVLSILVTLTNTLDPPVTTAGTTQPPGYFRLEGIKAQSTCPESHPYPLDYYKSCCMHKNRNTGICGSDTDSVLREWDGLECCPNSDYILCPVPLCKAHITALNIPEETVEAPTTAPPTTAAPTLAPCTNPTSDNGEIVPEAVLKCGDSVSGTTTCKPGTGTGLDECEFEAETTPGVWYKFEDPSGNPSSTVTFTTCDGPHEYDARMYVFDDAGCGGAEPGCVEGNGDGPGLRCKLMSEITVAPAKGGAAGRYYIFVSGYSQETGTFRLDANCS